MTINIYSLISALNHINEGSGVGIADVDGVLFNIKACANFLVKSLKLFASNKKSFGTFFATTDPSCFFLLVATQA